MLKVREQDIPTRYFLAPINTGFAYLGQPTPQLIKFHSDRSGKSIGISYVGNVAIRPNYATNNYTLYFSKELEQWSNLVNVININGSIPGIQLACRSSQLVPPRNWKNKDKHSLVKTIQQELSSIPEDHIKGLVNEFVESAKISANLGFKVIQIHAAHGYLLSQLMNRILNTRDDDFGKNPIFLIKLVVEAIRHELPTIILDVRVSVIDGLEEREEEIRYKSAIIDAIADLDCDIISLSNGMYDVDKQLIYPLRSWGHAVYLPLAVPFCNAHSKKLWNTAGNIWDFQLLTHMPSNLSFSIGRSLIADPSFVEKSLSGDPTTILACQRNGHCHYYSRGTKHIICPVDAYLKSLAVLPPRE